MKAIVKTQKSPGAELIDMAIPEPKANEVLVKPIATSICGTDVHIYNWDSAAQVYIKKVPQILGHEFAGEIVEIGREVNKLRVKNKAEEIRIGDYVSAETHIFCGECVQCKPGNDQRHICKKGEIFGLTCNGCFAEYFTIPGIVIWKNNPAIPPEIASLQEPLGNAVYCALANDKNLKGKKVLILGDGPTGLMACGVAKAEGSPAVVLVGRHSARLAIARRMGADVMLNDDQQEDIAQFVLDITHGEGVDVVLEMAGSEKALDIAFKSVRKGGRISAFGIYGGPFTIGNYGQLVRSGIEVIAISGRRIWQTWRELTRLLESGRLDISPIITHKLPLEEFKKGFDLMTKKPKVSGKVILYP